MTLCVTNVRVCSTTAVFYMEFILKRNLDYFVIAVQLFKKLDANLEALLEDFLRKHRLGSEVHLLEGGDELAALDHQVASQYQHRVFLIQRHVAMRFERI